MKKFTYLLAVLVPFFAFTACDDNDSLPDVDFKVQIADAAFYNGELYVVQGDTIKIESVEVVNNEKGKSVTIPYINYFFDYQALGRNVIEPYQFDIAITESVVIGKHYLELTAPVFAVDKEPGYAVVTYTVNVVQSLSDIPIEAQHTVMTHAHMTDSN